MDFYVNKLRMQKVEEMHFDTATNYFAIEYDPSSPTHDTLHLAVSYLPASAVNSWAREHSAFSRKFAHHATS
jgi:hypothetical protein